MFELFNAAAATQSEAAFTVADSSSLRASAGPLRINIAAEAIKTVFIMTRFLPERPTGSPASDSGDSTLGAGGIHQRIREHRPNGKHYQDGEEHRSHATSLNQRLCSSSRN